MPSDSSSSPTFPSSISMRNLFAEFSFTHFSWRYFWNCIFPYQKEVLNKETYSLEDLLSLFHSNSQFNDEDFRLDQNVLELVLSFEPKYRSYLSQHHGFQFYRTRTITPSFGHMKQLGVKWVGQISCLNPPSTSHGSFTDDTMLKKRIKSTLDSLLNFGGYETTSFFLFSTVGGCVPILH